MHRPHTTTTLQQPASHEEPAGGQRAVRAYTGARARARVCKLIGAPQRLTIDLDLSNDSASRAIDPSRRYADSRRAEPVACDA